MPINNIAQLCRNAISATPQLCREVYELSGDYLHNHPVQSAILKSAALYAGMDIVGDIFGIENFMNFASPTAAGALLITDLERPGVISKDPLLRPRKTLRNIAQIGVLALVGADYARAMGSIPQDSGGLLDTIRYVYDSVTPLVKEYLGTGPKNLGVMTGIIAGTIAEFRLGWQRNGLL
jgi:hypothetical protein